jgi:hypothetical protein
LEVKFANSLDFWRQSFIKFDISQLPTDIQTANLVLKVKEINRNIQFSFNVSVTTTDWSESRISWNLRPSSRLITGATRQVSQSTVTIDVLPAIQQAIQNRQTTIGFHLWRSVGDTVARMIFHSREAGDSRAPKLYINTNAT